MKIVENLREEGTWKSMKIVDGIELASHQQFVDDTILFGDAKCSEEWIIKNCLDICCRALGQRINSGKSEMFFLTHD